MGRKLHGNLFLLFLLFLPVLVWGQCPTSVSISADTGSTICEGTLVEFSANIPAGSYGTLAYDWQIGGNSVSSSSTFTSNNLKNLDEVQLIINSLESDGTTPCSEISNTIKMTVNPNRTGSVSIQANKTNICPGETINFSIASSANLGSNPVYDWQLTRGGSTSSLGSSSTYSASNLQQGDQIQLIVQSNIPCVSPNPVSSNSISITQKPGTPGQPGVITGLSSICPGTSQTYSISAVANATEYVWSLPSGWSGSSTGTSITLTAGNSGGTIGVSAKNECGTSTNRTLVVAMQAAIPATPGVITGDTAVCPGISKTYSVTAVTNASEYIWTLPSGWTGSSTTNSITVNTGSSGSNGNISVIAKNSCGQSTPRSLAVNVKTGTPATPSAISGTTSVCPGTSQTYSVTNVPGVTYTWSLPSGWSGSSTGSSITTTTGTNPGNISVTAKNDCGESASSILAVTVKPGTPATPGNFTSGPNSLCPGSTGTYTVPAVTGAAQYIWTLPSGFSTPNLTTTSPSIVVTASSSGSGNITVVAKNDCGTSTARSIAVSIGNPAPVMSGSITGPTKVCKSTTGIQYTIPAITNATSYAWVVPSGWTIAAGQGTNTITVSTPASVSSNNNISVVASNGCGTTAQNSISVNASNSVPGQPGVISTNLTSNAICPPVQGVTFSVVNVSGTTYNWIVPNGFQFVSGQGTNEITVNITSTTAYGNNLKVEVEAVNACGPSTRRAFNNIAINNYAIADLGVDQTLCSSTNTLNLSGTVGFGTGGIKIESITSNGNGIVSNVPNGSTTNFTYNYKPSSQDLSNGSVILTLTTEAPSGKPNCTGQGTDQMTIFFRPNPTATISANSPVCSGTTSTVTVTGTPNTRVTYRIGTGADQTIDIGSSGSANLTTAALSANTTYNLRSIQYQAVPNCSTTLSASTTITVTPAPTATISYNGPFCTSQTTAQTVTLSGTGAYTGGSFNQPAGLSINSSGAITPSTSSPGEYTVTYTTLASGGCEAVTATTQVIIQEETFITSQPVNSRACAGDDITLEVIASGTNLNYQWYFGSAVDGNQVSGGTSSTLTLSNISESQEGNYYVVVDDAASCAPVTSTATELIVDQEIIIESQSPNITACEGDSANIEVVATSGGNPLDTTFIFRWYKGSPGSGTLLNGLNSTSLPFNNLVPENSGDYYVEIMGSSNYTCQSIISSVTTLTVRPTPVVEISGDANICDGEAAQIYFSNGTPNTVVTYVINSNNTNPQNILLDAAGEAILDTGILNATSNTDTDFEYKLTSIAYPDAPDCSNTVSGAATITVAPTPTATLSFIGGQVEFCTKKDDALFTPILNGTGNYTGGSFSSNGLNVNSSDGSFNPSANPPGDYTITYNIPPYGGCIEESASIDISIYEEVLITSEPFNLGICSTENAEFSVVATGDDLTYQWFKDGSLIPGATAATLSLPVAISADSGEYYVMV